MQRSQPDPPDAHADTGDPPVSVQDVRAQAGPAHPAAVLLGRSILRFSRLATRLVRTGEERGNLKAAGAEWFDVAADDGVRLSAFALSPSSAPTRPTVVVVPGWLERKEQYAEAASRLTGAGHRVVVMDLRAHGGSGGEVCTFSATERHDLEAVARGARARGLLEGDYLTLGTSTGAVTALRHAFDHPEVAGVAAFGPFLNLADAIRFFRGLTPGAPKRCEPWLLRGVREAALRRDFCVDDIDLGERMACYGRPVLFVASYPGQPASLADQVQVLFDRKADGWKRWVTLDDATHFDLTAKAWPAMADHVRAWSDAAGEA